MSKYLTKSHDGGPDSGVTGYWLVEAKSAFSIVLLHFRPGTRDAYHSHAFNALSLWLWGTVTEHMLSGERNVYRAGNLKYTPRECFHKVEAHGSVWCLSIRGPWVDSWMEFKWGRLVRLTHGRKVVSE